MKNLEINDYELTWYMQEILMHCSGACMGYNRLVNLLGDPKTIQSRLTWFELTSFLSHAAMISKYLSPIAKGHVATMRKNQLRKTLNIPEDSEVLPRDARDNIEHFDERIDNWIGGRQSNILEIVIQDREAFVHLRGNEKKIKRLFILDGMLFLSENKDGTKFELNTKHLFDEINRIKLLASQFIEQKSPYYYLKN